MDILLVLLVLLAIFAVAGGVVWNPLWLLVLVLVVVLLLGSGRLRR